MTPVSRSTATGSSASRKAFSRASSRLLREFASARPELLAYVDMERVSRTLNEWPGHAFVRDERVDAGYETDFLGLGCRKRTP